LLDDDGLWFDTDRSRRDLRVRCLRALAERRARGLQVEPAVVASPDMRRVGARDVRHTAPHEGGRTCAGVFDVGAEPDAKAAPAGALVRARGLVVEGGQRRLERGRVIARFIGMAGDAQVRQLLSPDEVDAPNVGWVQAEPARYRVHE